MATQSGNWHGCSPALSSSSKRLQTGCAQDGAIYNALRSLGSNIPFNPFIVIRLVRLLFPPRKFDDCGEFISTKEVQNLLFISFKTLILHNILISAAANANTNETAHFRRPRKFARRTRWMAEGRADSLPLN